MHKTMTIAENSGIGNLTSFFARKRGVLINRFLPGWTNNKIDSQLFMPAGRSNKSFRLPRGFEQSDMTTDDGKPHAKERNDPSTMPVRVFG